jgi:branched-chain amino acid transport system substrate-binding protein
MIGRRPIMAGEPNMEILDRRSVVIAATAGLVGALGIAWAAAENCPTQCATGKVPLGIAAPTSGPPSSFGLQTVKAAEIVVRELNAAGGLMGVPVELVVDDDRCDPGRSVSVAARHVEQVKLNFVIGPTCPAAAMAAAPVYAKGGVIQFVPTVTMIGLTRSNPDNIFRIAATDEQEAQALGAYLAREQKGKKFAIVYTDVFYRRTDAEMVRAALPDAMKTSARFEPILDVSGAYDRVADKLQRDPPDVIYMALDTEPVVEFVRKLRERGIKSFLIGGQHLLSQNFWVAAGKAAEGINVIAPIQSVTSVEFRKTVDLLRQAQVVPDLVALNSYAAVETWAEAVRRAGGGDPKKVVAALRSGVFKTAVGPVAFDQRGDRRDICYSLLTWQGGRLMAGAGWREQASDCQALRDKGN